MKYPIRKLKKFKGKVVKEITWDAMELSISFEDGSYIKHNDTWYAGCVVATLKPKINMVEK